MGRVISTCIQFIDAFSNPSRQTINSMRRMANEAKKAGKSIQSAGNTIQNAGKSLTKAVTAPIAGVGIAAVKTAADFDNSMAKVSTIADTTAVPMKKLREQVKTLSNEVGVGVTDIAEAQYQAISAGVDTAKSANFVSTAVKAAKGGFTDTTTAVDGLTTVLNAYGLKAGEAANISDQMLMAQNYGKTSFGEMASSMGKVIPTASSMNVSTKELFSSIAVLTKNGIATSEAVTSLKAAFSNVSKVSPEVSKTAKKLGLDFSAAHLKSVGWSKFLSEIKEKTGGNVETMSKLFGSTEALNGMLILAGKGSKDFSEALGLMDKAGGSTQKAYKKMLTPTERMNISLNKVKNSLIKFGAALTPVFDKAAEVIGKVGDRLNKLSKSQVNSIIKWAGMAATIGPSILIFGKAVTGIGKAVSTFGKLQGAVASAGSVLKLITSPAGIVIGVLAAIAVAAVLVVKNWDKIKPVVMNVKEWFVSTFGSTIKQAISGFKTVFVSAMNGIKSILPSVIQFVKNGITAAMPAIKAIVSALKIMLPAAIKTVKTVIQAALPIVQVVVTTLSKVLPKAIETAKGIIKSIAPVIQTVIGVVAKAVPVIASTFSTVLQKIGPVIKTIGNAIKAAVPVIGKLFSNAFSFAGKIIEKVMPSINKIAKVIGSVLVFAIRKVSPVISKLAGTFSSVFTTIFGVVSSMVKKLQPVFGRIGTIVKTVMSVVGKVISTTFSVIASVVSSTAGNIKEIIGGIVKVLGGVIDFIGGVFTGNWSKVWEGVKNIFGGIFDALVGLVKLPINAVIGLINGAIGGINSISVDIPEGIPLVGGKHIGFDIPTIPTLAKGTTDWKGGIVQISEKGGEIVDLPKGSRVYPHDQSVQMARKSGDGKLAATDRRVAKLERSAAGRKGNITINIPKLAEQIIVREDADIDRIAEEIVAKIEKTAANMGVA